MWPSVAAVGIGAALGALLRWQLSERLNRLFSDIPPGTLAANIIGGYIVGLALAFFAQREDLPVEWRLLIVTGFCGGLTTFSTFSNEIVSLLQQGRFGMAASGIALHVTSSLIATLAGIGTWQLLRGA
ncbi:MAG: putative fluoride ion transporter CrcB [Pseudomonadota bacterium]|jgi:CrcB protein